MGTVILNLYSLLNKSFIKLIKRCRVKMLFIIVFVSIVFSFVLYLLLVNSAVISGYKISKLERELAQKIEENKKLKFEIVQLQSYENIKKNIERMKFVKLKDVKYIDNTKSVAFR